MCLSEVYLLFSFSTVFLCFHVFFLFFLLIASRAFVVVSFCPSGCINFGMMYLCHLGHVLVEIGAFYN